jgi:ribosomal protein S18 acetylase RimI-like enzyme
MRLLYPLTASDFPAVDAIFTSAFHAKHRGEFLDAWKSRCADLSVGIVAEEGDGLASPAHGAPTPIAAFILVRRPAPRTISIEFLGVSPTAQKGGLGTILLRHVLDVCDKTRSCATLVPVNDQRIIQWYKKHGFDFYGPTYKSRYTGDDEQRMQRTPADPGGLCVI